MAVLTDFSVDSWKVVKYALSLVDYNELYLLCHAKNGSAKKIKSEFEDFVNSLSAAYGKKLHGHVISGDLALGLSEFSDAKDIETLIIPKAIIDKGKLIENVDNLINRKVMVI